ncbi:hypothetical protein [Nonomuraea sp. KM90]|uniref:hypothetical protein n=1 Tax=Nonomuraea sp. KM90 TaxID=3457428 RepID=UPI003FCC7E3B
MSGSGDGDASREATDPDVYLDVPVVRVEEIDLTVRDLRAKVSLQAEVLDLLRLNVGADVLLGSVELGIKGVEAQALLKVRLDNVARIIDRVLKTIDDNPQILEHITRGLGTAVQDLGTGAGYAVRDVGAGAGHAVRDVGTGAAYAVRDVGAGAANAVRDVGAGAGGAVRDVGAGAGDVVRDVGPAVGGAVQDATGAVQDVATGAVQGVGSATGPFVQRAGADAYGVPAAANGAPPRPAPQHVGEPHNVEPQEGEPEDGEPDEHADHLSTSELATALARKSLRAGRDLLGHVTDTAGHIIRHKDE